MYFYWLILQKCNFSYSQRELPEDDPNGSKHIGAKIYILLTVHHVLILGKWPTWHIILFYVCIYIFNSLHVSSKSCSSSGETNCVNTTSGSCHSVSLAVSCAGRKFSSDLHTTRPPTATRGCIDTVCLSWWWARCARNI